MSQFIDEVEFIRRVVTAMGDSLKGVAKENFEEALKATQQVTGYFTVAVIKELNKKFSN